MFEKLGKALALLREIRNLSQAALARKAGIGKSQLSKYERGRELPKFDSLEKILKALEVSAHQFFYVFYFIDTASEMVERSEDRSLYSLLPPALLSSGTEKALFQVLSDLVHLSRCVFEEQVARSTKRDQ